MAQTPEFLANSATRNASQRCPSGYIILAYDSKSNSFKGTVENTTKKTLKRVRVEVHLSNGKELGPTTPGELKPGEKRNITLAATSKGFQRWNAHPEVGSGEHGHREGRGEHNGIHK